MQHIGSESVAGPVSTQPPIQLLGCGASTESNGFFQRDEVRNFNQTRIALQEYDEDDDGIVIHGRILFLILARQLGLVVRLRYNIAGFFVASVSCRSLGWGFWYLYVLQPCSIQSRVQAQ